MRAGQQSAVPVRRIVTAKPCRRCSECMGSEHHWLDGYVEGGADADHSCKHCSALGQTCEACDGSGDAGEGEFCEACDGYGVIATGRLRRR